MGGDNWGIWYDVGMMSNATTPEEYIAGIESPRRVEIQAFHGMIKKIVPKLKVDMRFGMIGYGTFHYKYASGKEGDWPLIALAAQKNYISIYVCATDGKGYLAEKYKKQLPRTNIGKSCIRFKSLSDIDLDVLKEILLKAQEAGGAGLVKA